MFAAKQFTKSKLLEFVCLLFHMSSLLSFDFPLTTFFLSLLGSLLWLSLVD